MPPAYLYLGEKMENVSITLLKKVQLTNLGVCDHMHKSITVHVLPPSAFWLVDIWGTDGSPLHCYRISDYRIF